MALLVESGGFVLVTCQFGWGLKPLATHMPHSEQTHETGWSCGEGVARGVGMRTREVGPANTAGRRGMVGGAVGCAVQPFVRVCGGPEQS